MPSQLQSARRLRPASPVVLFASVAATTVVILTGCSGGATPAASVDASAVECESMTPVSIMMGSADMDVSYTPYATLPMQLGYFAEECLDVTVSTTGGSVTTAQALTSGTADIAMSSPDNLIIAGDSEPLPVKMIYNLIPRSIYTLAVLPDSDIEDYDDLAGATVGLTAASPLYEAYLSARLEEQGLSYADITTAAVGYGATPMEALQSAEIDAFLAWPGLWASYENAGYEFRLLPEADWQSDFYGIGLASTNDYIEANPEVIEAVSRGVAKASVWLQSDENADEAVRMFWEEYPERAPLPGDDEDLALERDRLILDATRDVMGITSLPADTLWGAQSSEKWDAQMQFDLTYGVITKELDTSEFFTNDFNDAANEFDRAEITG